MFVIGGSNRAIHTWLSALWDIFTARGCLPRKIYVEIDGGSENANQEMKILCNLIVACNIGCEEIWLVRMPSGHNHADQDADFGVVWVFCRDENLLSPKEYADAVRTALKGVTVIDLFVIPDYESFLAPCRDPHFGLSDKLEYTQHVWRFRKVVIVLSFHRT